MGINIPLGISMTMLLIIATARNGLASGHDDNKMENVMRELNQELAGLYKNQNFKGTEDEQNKIKGAVTEVHQKLNEEKEKNNGKGVENTLKILTSIKDNLDKLKSDQPSDIMAGGLAIALTVAAIVPPPAGPALTIVGTLASVLMPFFTPQKKKSNKLLDGFKDILLEENDQQIKQDLAGEKNVIATELSVLYGYKNLTDDQIDRRKITTVIGDDVLGSLAYRIKNRATDGTKSSGRAAFYLAVSYVDFAAYRDIALGRMIILLGNSGEKGQMIVQGYQRAMKKHTLDYEDHLKIFYLHTFENIDVLTNYHPPLKDEASSLLTKFMEKHGLPSPPVVDSGMYVVKSVEWPDNFLTRECEEIKKGRFIRVISFNCWLKFREGHPSRLNRIEFIRLSSGYYRMKMMDGNEYKYISANKTKNEIVKLRKGVDRDNGGDIVVLKINEEIIFSNRNSPAEYWNGRSNRYSVYFCNNKEADYEDGKKFKLIKCRADSPTDQCPDW